MTPTVPIASHGTAALVHDDVLQVAPATVGRDRLGGGSVYPAMASGEAPAEDVFGRDPALLRADYARTVEYPVATFVSYVETHGDDDLVLVLLGDHQPAPFATGPDAGRDVPITVVSRDPAVSDRAAGCGWTDGPTPGSRAPTGTFRDRFPSTFR